MSGGLGKWFGEKWVDVKTGEECGRSGKDKGRRPYPACRPKAVAGKMSAEQKRSMVKAKDGPKRKRWPVSPSGRNMKPK